MVASSERLFGTTIGLIESELGQIAVTTWASIVGATIAPPAESECAVDPVGVATIMPSASKFTSLRPSILRSSLMSRAKAPWFITASFRAMNVASFLPWRYAVTLRSARLSMLYFPLNILSRFSSIFSRFDSVRNPRLPKLTPRMRTLFRHMRRAVLRRVPSPPRTIAKSTFFRSSVLL